ncbi:ATP-binding protein [Nocardioides cavernae]|uniref:ATP-binding protein n=1 Tax=Nocardioides cavernae TaxID=1921566 RepID=A0ABR8N5F3_9ACTN|nr:ATP-binding protein [Nocardioides cavernae]MBD3923397.1 ATP-binding protein [Nocardioides cavernae]MBM7511680.1 anti-sigma regulatory factor (Ser/Thr protein kinase) [Nocardioides cavernae]
MQGAPSRLQVRLAADAASVPAVRRFVADGLTAWGEGRLVDAAELVASELSSNAALHAMAEFMHVTLERPADVADGVRVAVEDDGPVGVEAVLPRTRAGDDLDWDELDATGRGLTIVALLAGRWGVDETRRGKRVWADLVDPEPVHEALDPERAETDAGPSDGELPPGWTLVRHVQSPVALSLRQDSHLDELVRELQLLAVDEHDSESAALAEEIQELLVSPAHARLTARRAVEQARDEGLDLVDVELAMPREFGVMVEQLQQAVDRADRLCEEGVLLTLASPPEVRALRAWMTHEVVAQTSSGSAPMSWPEWVAATSSA